MHKWTGVLRCMIVPACTEEVENNSNDKFSYFLMRFHLIFSDCLSCSYYSWVFFRCLQNLVFPSQMYLHTFFSSLPNLTFVLFPLLYLSSSHPASVHRPCQQKDAYNIFLFIEFSSIFCSCFLFIIVYLFLFFIRAITHKDKEYAK